MRCLPHLDPDASGSQFGRKLCVAAGSGSAVGAGSSAAGPTPSPFGTHSTGAPIASGSGVSAAVAAEPKSKKGLLIGTAVGLLLLVVAGVGAYKFFNRKAPVNLHDMEITKLTQSGKAFGVADLTGRAVRRLRFRATAKNKI